MEITNVLTGNNINIWGSVTNDSAEFGIIRMVVSDPELAKEKLEEAGFFCRLCNVIGVEMADEVGALNRLLKTLYESNINVDYIYLSFNRDSSLPVWITSIFPLTVIPHFPCRSCTHRTLPKWRNAFAPKDSAFCK